MNPHNFLPEGYEKLSTVKPYVNLSKLTEGEHRFRIVQRPIAGWIDWKDKKPYRYRPDQKPKVSFDPEKPMRPFWALHVWDYAKEGLYIMEVTQASIRKALQEFGMNEDWGDLTTFDIKIKKEGSGKETEYSVIPVPHKPLSAPIKEALKSAQVRLEALYEGKDPWKDLDDSVEPLNTESRESSKQLTMSQDLELKFALEQLDPVADNMYLDDLADHVGVISIYEIEAKDFERVMRSINKRIASKTEGKSA